MEVGNMAKMKAKDWGMLLAGVSMVAWGLVGLPALLGLGNWNPLALLPEMLENILYVIVGIVGAPMLWMSIKKLLPK
jgi:uncharacterized membrane protein YuzA (DUF378 family)